MRHFTFSERAPGDWDVGDGDRRIFTIRTHAPSGKVYLRDERPGHTQDIPREFASVPDIMAALARYMMAATPAD